jgi:hypothetical protein
MQSRSKGARRVKKSNFIAATAQFCNFCADKALLLLIIINKGRCFGFVGSFE